MLTLAEVGDLPTVLDTEQVAELFGICTRTVREQTAAGTFPVPVIRIGRALRWPTSSVLRVLGIDVAAD